MARIARTACESDMYHIILKGVGRQIIFEDDCDRSFFMDSLVQSCRELDVAIVAWCLMSNHAHLVLHAPIEFISKAMHHFETTYAAYFNRRHGRVGILFKGRFDSVAIKTNEQLMATVRYVHCNPVKAGGVLESRWSSYLEHLGRADTAYSDATMVMSLFESAAQYEAFMRDVEHGAVREPRCRLTDAEALDVARAVLGKVAPHEVRSFDRPRRDEMLAALYEAGLSGKQIERITSVGLNIIYRASRSVRQ